MDELKSSFLFEASIQLSEPLAIGAGPEGFRAIYHVTEGNFSGPRMKGRYLPSGGEWARIRLRDSSPSLSGPRPHSGRQ